MQLLAHYNRLPTELVEIPSLEIPKTWLAMVLDNLFYLALLEKGGIALDDLKRSLSTEMILWFSVMLNESTFFTEI